MSLRLRFTLSFLLIVIITLATVSIAVRLGTERQVAVIRARGGLIGAEDLILDLKTYYVENGTWQGVETLLQTYDLGGRGMGQGGPGAQGGQSGVMGNRPGVRLADSGGVVIYDPVNPAGTALSESTLSDGIELKESGKTIGYLLPLDGQTFSGSEFETQLLQAVNKASLYAALIAGGLALVLALLLAYFLLRPVQQLTDAAADMAAGDLGQRVSIKGAGGELTRLGNAFNHMAGSLQAAEERRRTMTTDIAHELRTPLAVQRAQLEAMLDGVYPLETENLEKILDQNSLLTRLVQDLRTLTLADADELQLEITAVQVNDLVDRLTARFQPQAERKEILLSAVQKQSPLTVQADPQRLEQILSNLVDNALRHTPQGGSVEIIVSSENEKTLIRVHDTGPGIPEESLPFVFERFYRADRGRARETGGSGLGLAIARRLAEAQGANLTVENDAGGGAVFSLVFSSVSGVTA
jgi:signal transduction histidine kinase